MLIFKDKELVKITNIKAIHLWRDEFENDNIFHKFLANSFRRSRPYNDTFNILNKFQLINWSDLSNTLPKSVVTNKCKYSLCELFDLRTKELFEQHDKLTILWSGGCDSSAIITSIIRNNIDKNRYQILFGSGSIEEFPSFYTFMVKNKLPINYIGDSSIYRYLLNDKSEHYINGCPEQIFQYHALALSFQKYWWTNWKDGIINNLIDKNIEITNKEKYKLIDILDFYQSELKIKLHNTIDLMWVIITSAMWTAADYQWASEVFYGSRYIDNNTSYFKTLDFAKWGFTNSMYHRKEDDYTINPDRFRIEEKDYIRTIFNDPQEELKYKIKRFSQQREIKKCKNEYISIFHENDQYIKIPLKYSYLIKNLVKR